MINHLDDGQGVCWMPRARRRRRLLAAISTSAASMGWSAMLLLVLYQLWSSSPHVSVRGPRVDLVGRTAPLRLSLPRGVARGLWRVGRAGRQALDFSWAHQSALRAALAVSLVLCGAGVALLATAWRHETFPSRPRCIADDEAAGVAP